MTAPLEHGQLPDCRLQQTHVDVVGPLPISQGKSYLFTIIDCYTRWPEAIPMADATATSCACVLMSHHIAQFGMPTDITSDRGRNLPQTCRQPWGNTTGGYHPQAKGIVERFHRQLKARWGQPSNRNCACELNLSTAQQSAYLGSSSNVSTNTMVRLRPKYWQSSTRFR